MGQTFLELIRDCYNGRKPKIDVEADKRADKNLGRDMKQPL